MSNWKDFLLSIKDVQWLDFKKIFSFSYLSDSALPLSGPLVALLGLKFVVLILIGIVLNIVLGRKDLKVPIYSKLRGHITNMTLWLGFIGIILVLSRLQGIYMLSSRFLLLANVLAIIIWTIWIVYYSLVKLPKIAKEYHKRQIKDKYLPKKKKIRL